MRRFTDDEAAFARALLRGEDVGWPGWQPQKAQRFLAVAWDQGISGLLHAAVRNGRVQGTPEPWAHDLAAAAALVGALNGVRVAQAAHAVAALAATGIPSAALKGLAMVADGYAQVGLRPMTDVDLLVSPDHMAAGGAALEALGYVRAPMDNPGVAHHWVYGRTGAAGLPEALELHRQLFAAAPWDAAVSTAELLARRTFVPCAATSLPVLALPDRLLHAAGHLVVQHAGAERLIWVADIDRLVARAADDDAFWPAVRARATAWQLAEPLDAALAAAQDWFGTRLPAAGAPRGAPASRVAAPGQARPGARALRDVAASETWPRRAALVRAHAVPRPADMRAWYGVQHTWQLPYYYLRRWSRGVRDVLAERLAPPPPPRPPERWFVED